MSAGNSTAFPPTLVVDLPAVVGPQLLGGFLAWGLYGIFLTQVYMYSQAFTEDTRIIKALVFSMTVALTVQIIMFMDNLWKLYAVGFGNLATFNLVSTTWFSAIVIESIVSFTVQSFYARRIFIFSEKKLPTILIILTALVSVVAAMVSAGHAARAHFNSKLNVRSMVFEANIWQASAAVCDVTIAACMTYYLKRRAPGRDELGTFEKVNDIVNRIIRITIETGSFTAAVNIVTLALNIISSNRATYYQCALSTLTGIYANTFMVVLNSRIKFSVSSLSTWKDTESGRTPSLGNIVFKENSSSVVSKGHEVKVDAISARESSSQSDDMEFPPAEETKET